jgi:ABC-type nitrate/sulfonate/bicarbonate transport system permease component
MEIPSDRRLSRRNGSPLAASPARRAALRRRRIRSSVSLVAGLAIWELAARLVHNSLFIVPFTAVASRLAKMTLSGQIWPHLGASAYEFGVGFLLGAATGIAIGVVMAASRPVEEYLDVWVTVLYATPLVAMMPFFIILFGVGMPAKVAIVYVMVVFPVLINTFTGIRSTDADLLEMVRSFSASRGQIFREVLLPSALPFILAGLRLAVGRGLIAVVVGELFFSQQGLGYLINLAGQSFDTALLFVGVLILAVAGVVVTGALQSLERCMMPWRQ